MAKNLKTPASETESFCRSEVDRMLKYSQTKVIMPVVTLGLLRVFKETSQRIFSDAEIRKAYEAAVKMMKEFLGHDAHVGAKYYDAYGLRRSDAPRPARKASCSELLCNSLLGKESRLLPALTTWMHPREQTRAPFRERQR